MAAAFAAGAVADLIVILQITKKSMDGDWWLASLFIYYSKGPQNNLVTFTMPDTFKTYDGAIQESLAAAQKWIDERP